MSETNTNVITEYKDAPVPTPATVATRYNLVFQLGKFIAFNVRLVLMVLKGH